MYAQCSKQYEDREAEILAKVVYALILGVLTLLSFQGSTVEANESADASADGQPDGLPTAEMLTDYYHQMSVPKAFVVRAGEEFKAHQAELKERVLQSVGLWPLPERVALDVHESAPLDHPWCTIRRVYYQLWPHVYSSGLLYMPKELAEQPAPAMLCPHGHWKDGNAHPEVQRRCLYFAKLGYVTFSSTQNHYEDLCLGVSHQTLMIWNNIRALDYLESLPQVDKTRIGVAGASGGGLQTQMLVALDTRVKAATVVGLTCDFREIMFPDRHHCTCNHFPGVMQFTDHPEISALGLPAALQFLTMNDWTKNFENDNFPTIRKLYAANDLSDRVDCKYYDTPHSYDRPKRERTYWWMERWIRGKEPPTPVVEPDEVKTFPVETLRALSAEVPENKGFGEISNIYKESRGFETPAPASSADWQRYREQMREDLKGLLGLDATLPRATEEPREIAKTTQDEIVIERVGYASEGAILVPTIVLRRNQTDSRLPIVMILDGAGKESLLAEAGSGSPRELAREGQLVVLPDVRCFGEMFSTGGKDDTRQRQAWERNGIVWGRPVPGMSCTDIMGVLDGLSSRTDADMTQVKLLSRKSGDAAIAALFAAAVDTRITSIDVDLNHCCFEKRNLPLVSSVLQCGDVLQWASLAADRNMTLRNVPAEAGNTDWLRSAFAAASNTGGLRIDPR
jgi:hypothetical protein